jgi:hypothetical protein
VADTSENGPLIQQINFSEGGVEIVYVEPRDVEAFKQHGISETTVLGCPAALISDELAELVDDARQLVDAILVRKRNPRYGT